MEALTGRRWRPVLFAALIAACLYLLWGLHGSTSGGDLAAQEAWADFAREHPGSAYDLAWYGGMHPASYSLISPYVLAALGVHGTLVAGGIVSTMLLAWILVACRSVKRPLWPAAYGAAALFGNAVSGRATFGLGIAFALGSVAVLVIGPQAGRPLGARSRAGIAVLAAAATAASPVAGLFLGIVAASLWLNGRRADSLATGLPPVVLVVAGAVIFPFSGVQPMAAWSAALPLVIALACYVLVPSAWRTVRTASLLYAVAVLIAWLAPSPIGSNVTRLALVFGGVVLVAVATSAFGHPHRSSSQRRLGTRRTAQLLGAALVTATLWQGGQAVGDVTNANPGRPDEPSVEQLVTALTVRRADLGRVEAVPTKSHWESAVLAPHANLARGWNRQADAARNPLFYADEPLTAAAYRAWLDRWAIRFVVLPDAEPDPAAAAEAALVAAGLPYLSLLLDGDGWTLYAVQDPTPLVSGPAQVTHFDGASLVVRVTAPGEVLIRVPESPWLRLVDADGQPLPEPTACLIARETVPLTDEEPVDRWTGLRVTSPGLYRIAAPYEFGRSPRCDEAP